MKLVILISVLVLSVAVTAGRSSSGRGGFIDVPAGATARFLGTTTTCTNPKGQIPNGQVGCDVHYRAPRSMADLVPIKFDVGLTLRCVEVSKWARASQRILRSGRLC